MQLCQLQVHGYGTLVMETLVLYKTRNTPMRKQGLTPFQLTVTTECGIKSTSTTFNNIDVDENAMTQVVFYPNPTEGQLNISSLKPGGEGTVEIYSAIGTCLQRSTYADLEETIIVDLSTFPQGLYTLKVTSRSGVISQNITKI